MANRTCPTCGAGVPEGFGFCGHCGQKMAIAEPIAPPPPPPPTAPPPVGFGPPGGPPPPPRGSGVQLVVLRGPMPEGSTFDLKLGRNTVGREASISFSADNSLDPVHLTLDCRQGGVEIVEVSGEGGGFRRIRAPTRVVSGDIVFAGEQYLLVRRGDHAPREPVDPSQEIPEETFGTPLPPPQLHVTQLLASGIPGRVASTDKATLTVGRENSDLSFPQDRFMSGRHMRIEADGEGLLAIDVGSLNGTFARVTETPLPLSGGDEIMIGTVLFRVDFT